MFAKMACIYIQTDQQGNPIRIGKASQGLEARYRGGTGYALDAAMHSSNNLVFVATVPKELCKAVEDELIWQGRQCLSYNNQGKLLSPFRRLTLVHEGVAPPFDSFGVNKTMSLSQEVRIQ